MKRDIQFEELPSWFGVDGTVEVIPTNVIGINQAWRVRFNFKTHGVLNYLLNGRWYLRLCLEKMGVEELDLQEAEGCIAFVARPYSYSAEITIPAGRVPAGIYKLAASITMISPLGIPSPIVGFAKIEFLQFFEVGSISVPAVENEYLIM